VEDFVEQLARGNVTEVKVVLASIVLALAVYQVFLMAVVYGKLRLPFLASRPASFTHRAAGDTIVVITVIIAFMCLSYFGIEDGESDEDMRAALHVAAGSSLLAVLTLKIVVVRWWHRMGKWLPALGLTVFLLFALTWLTSAGDFLGG
jgi:Ni,Fe-hydrogenase I cytochrome b subunit